MTEIYLGSGNFTADLFGPEDTRLGCYGHAESIEFPLTFKPPEGYRVRILHIEADLVAWPKGRVDPGLSAGVLLALHTTGAEGSVRGDWMADNHMAYVQGAVWRNPTRVPISADVELGGLLEPDHKLMFKMAAWLNTTRYAIHSEVTFSITYGFEPQACEGDDA